MRSARSACGPSCAATARARGGTSSSPATTTTTTPILPWITILNLGSRILSIVRRRLPADWTERYNFTPVHIEAFVETPRYTGSVYKGSGRIYVGTTKRRGRYDMDKHYNKPKKDIWLRPLRKDWQRTLNR